ncbi:outer membrane beta-barrel protein [Geomonas propionica]|uniref:Outer membrane beta-barrel protein n=1 Tax=Geomonas propionica TaxID=2798582 RepID=A0ABS0YNG6_9BACT|nr:outer membrane beta-barrel protein [Geomonas propionica]MBJ6799468.1 outer membrane beta-barrel protein [Geomonas propionica]
MRKMLLLCAAALLMAAPLAGNASAEDLRGRIAVSGKIGVSNPAESEVDTINGRMVVSTDAGLTGGLGFLFGVDDNVAVEMEVSRTRFDASSFGDADVTDVSIGAQYRFAGQQHVVPYIGAGIDVLINDLDRKYTNTTVGAHVSGGVDFFMNRQVALNLEMKGVEAFKADVDGPNGTGKFDPSALSFTVGARFFFN